MAADPRRRVLLGRTTEDDDEDVDEVLDVPMSTSTSQQSQELPTTILPSPLVQHHSGPTALRFRNALTRVQENPMTDTEAWQALWTEVQVCFESIVGSNSAGQTTTTADVQAKLQWMESVYGTLLHYFPYSKHVALVAQMLFQLSNENTTNPLLTLRIRQDAQQKLEYLLTQRLGVTFDNENGDTAAADMQSDKPSASNTMLVWMVDLWMVYIQVILRLTQRQQPQNMYAQGLKAYQRAAPYAGHVPHENHTFWQQYLQFAQAHSSTATANDPSAANTHINDIRKVYQELLVIPMVGLDSYWTQYEAWERGLNAALAQALVQELVPKYQHARTVQSERMQIIANYQQLQVGRLATQPDPSDLETEFGFLGMWKKYLSYERTNPCRYEDNSTLHRVIRMLYQQYVSVCMRHPEAWHSWSSWEDSVEQRRAVLQLGQEHLPDCTLLAYAEAQVVASSNDEECMDILHQFLERSPNSLGFILYQQYVRRFKGIDAARQVFRRARRVLRRPGAEADSPDTSKGAEDTTDQPDSVDAPATSGAGGAAAATVGADTGASEDATRPKIVMNRVDTNGTSEPATEQSTVVASPMTWHVYAAHALMEHRTNGFPDIARKIFRLGLDTHASFLSSAKYCQMYAQVLMELRDAPNLQALLTRAVSANSGNKQALQVLWDLQLQVSALMLNNDNGSSQDWAALEQARWSALYGTTQDVATGGLVGQDRTLVSAQKTSIHEQLVRLEGFDTSSAIVSGLERELDGLELLGLWGRGMGRPVVLTNTTDAADLRVGGVSDASLYRRLEFQRMAQEGHNMSNVAGGTSGSGMEKRMPTAATPATMMMAIQSMPEWLRPLCLKLPATRLRVAVVPKPPPHLVELALATLKANALPNERPAGGGGKRPRQNDDSDDEDMQASGGGGYGNQFRARQRARLTAA